jgi:iron complex outermembrane recepter protein
MQQVPGAISKRLALLISLIGAPVWAAESDVVLPTVEVSASGTRSDLEENSLKNPYRVESTARFGTEVMTREDIEAIAPKDVLDLLDKAVGMNLTYQGRKSPYFLEERGGGNLTYILDGAILPSSANRILQKIPLAAIEQIQIMRGSTSLALGPTIPIGSSNSGSGITTGFVIIRTRQPKGTEAEFSAFAEQAVDQPTASGQSVYIGTRTKQDAPVNGYIAGMASTRDTPSKNSWFDGSDADAHMLTGGFSVGKFSVNSMLYSDTGSFQMQRGVTVTGTLDSSRWWYDPLKTDILSSDMTMAWNDEQVTMLSVFHTKYQQDEHDGSFANSTLTNRHFDERSSGYNLRHNARFGDTLIQLSRQYTESEGFGPNLSSNYNNWKTSIDGWSAAIEQKLFAERLTLDAGYRSDLKHIDYSATSATKLTANNDADMAPARVATLGARWKINDTYALNGRYFDGDEGTSGDFDIRTQSGTALDPTRQKRKEVALEADLASYFKPMLTWFDVDIRNQKTATTNTYVVDGDTYYYYTQADALRRGFELLIKGDLTPRTSYSFAITHLYKNTTTSNGATTDALGVSEPLNSITARLSHAWADWRANVSLKQVSSWDTSTSAMGTAYDVNLGGYTRVDANVMRDFKVDGHRMTIELYGRNLGDDKYATRYTTGYYYDRGRTVGLQFTARL